MELTFLGTSCMVPTKERNVQGIFLEHKGQGMLVDCGEGTQRQMNIAGINRNRVDKVLLTHWHGDHVSGLVGLIQTIGNNEGEKKLQIYGPKGTKQRMYHLLNAVVFDNKVKLTIKELEPRNQILRFYESQEYVIECINLKHSTPCLAYRFVEKDKLRIQMAKAKKLGLREGPAIGKLQRGQTVVIKGKEIKPEDVAVIQKGKKIVFILDTDLTKNMNIIAEQADLLVIESTYVSSEEEKAEKYKHLTARQAALVAQASGVKKMLMTHFSQRYTSTAAFEEEARIHLPESYAAYDFLKVKV